MGVVLLLLVAAAGTYLWYRTTKDKEITSGQDGTGPRADLEMPQGEAISHFDKESDEAVWKSVPELVEDSPVVEEPSALDDFPGPVDHADLGVTVSQIEADCPGRNRRAIFVMTHTANLRLWALSPVSPFEDLASKVPREGRGLAFSLQS